MTPSPRPTLALLAALAAAPLLAGTPPDHSYRIPEGVIGLDLYPDRVSVGLRTPAWQDARLELPSGRVLAPGRPTVAGAWALDLVPQADAAARSMKPDLTTRIAAARQRQAEALTHLRARSDVEWAYPVYQSRATGELLYTTPHLLIRARPGIDEATLRGGLGEVLIEEAMPLAERQWRVRVVDLDADPVAVANRLAEHPALEWAQPDFAWEIHYAALPNDPMLNQSWHLKNTGQGNPAGTVGADGRLEAAWNYSRGDGSVVIAVLDDGVQWSHPDLASRIYANKRETVNGLDDDLNGYVDDIRGWDFFQNDNNPDPVLTGPGSHGTSVAGVAAAAGNNSLGGSGSCQNCRILPVRIAGASYANDSTIANAINYAVRFADVLNNSWGGGSPSAAIGAAIDNAKNNGRGGLGAPVLFANGNSASGYLTQEFSFVGSQAGIYTLEWAYVKDNVVSAGFDTAWLDNVDFPNDSLGVETFEGASCTGLPASWTSAAYPGSQVWSRVQDETRSSSTRGGRCAVKAGATLHSGISSISRDVYISGGAESVLRYEVWASSERTGGDGTGQLTNSCYDYLALYVIDPFGDPYGPFNTICGTWSNQGNPLRDGVLSSPSSDPDAISIGAVANFDRRSAYSQWGLDMFGNAGVDVVAHSDGGSLGIVAPDIVGANGYGAGDYTNTFGGTSSATPFAAGIVGLLLSKEADLTYDQVRTRLRQATRKIGSVPYSSGRNLQYGFGALDANMLLSVNPTLLFANGFESGFLRWGDDHD